MKDNNYFVMISGTEALTVCGGSKARELGEFLGYLVGKWMAIFQKNREGAVA